MKNFRATAWATVAAAAGIAWSTARGGDDDAVKAELQRVAGTWRLTLIEKDGSKVPDDEVKQNKLVITGEQYTVRRGDRIIEKGTVRIDPTRTPRTIDIFPTEPEGKVQLGLYEWDGEKRIRICFTHPGSDQTRPKEFSTTKGTGHVMEEGERETDGSHP
jgi:uncharacterized protein (TIGR03067 family)